MKKQAKGWSAARRKKFQRTVRAKRGSLKANRRSESAEVLPEDLNPESRKRGALSYLNLANEACLKREQSQKPHRLDRIIHLSLLLAIDDLTSTIK